MENLLDQFRKIRTFIFDIDGVLTDGTVLLLENGLQARKMHVKDGLALQMAMKKGYRVVVVSGANSEPVIGRMGYLGIEEIHCGVSDKKQFFADFTNKNKIPHNEVLFMGDDLPDLPLLQEVGISCCPADAIPEVRKICTYISPVNGGYGCVRDVIEKVLRLNDHWHSETDIVSR